MRNYRQTIVATLVLLTGLAGCQGGSKDHKDKPANGSNQGAGSGSGSGSGQASGTGSGANAPAAPAKDIHSKDILARTDPAPEVYVKHVLLAWKDLAVVYRGHLDPRAAKRTNAEAATLAQDLAAKLKADPDSITALTKEHSEDPGSLSGE